MRVFCHAINACLQDYLPAATSFWKLLGNGQEIELVRSKILSQATLNFMAAKRTRYNCLKWNHKENSILSSSSMKSPSNKRMNFMAFENASSFVKSGEAWLQEGGEFEVQIEMDPDDIDKVTWEFNCKCDTPVSFEAR